MHVAMAVYIGHVYRHGHVHSHGHVSSPCRCDFQISDATLDESFIGSLVYRSRHRQTVQLVRRDRSA